MAEEAMEAMEAMAAMAEEAIGVEMSGHRWMEDCLHFLLPPEGHMLWVEGRRRKILSS